MPFNPKTNVVDSRHAVIIVGYTRQGFIVQNSWGPSWNTLTIAGNTYPGCALLSFDDAQQTITDAWVATIPGKRRVKRIWRPGFKTDSVEGEISENDDRLGIMTEVRALSAIVATKKVEPPLSIGLFGDWGTGKSFFMRQMQRHIREIDRQAATDEHSPYCTNIVQIRFNAWHYLDTNLWASLVSQIFGDLLKHVEDRATEEEQREKIKEELRSESRLLKEAQDQLERAKREKATATTRLEETKQELQVADTTLAEARDDLDRLFNNNPALRGQLDAVVKDLGIETAAKKLSELNKQAVEIGDLSRQITLAWQRITRPEGLRRRMTMLALTGIVAIALPLLLSTYAQQLTAAATVFTEIVSLAGAAAAWLLPRLNVVRKKAGMLQDMAQQIDVMHKQRVEALTATERKEVEQKTTAVRDAQTLVAAKESRVTQLTLELERLDPAEQLREFILARGSSGDYTRQLGIVSMVRNDFERLTRLLNPANAAEKPKVPIPVQRIVLYIDDLDRCTPERVVAVLEAVHLLLAFRLFVVIVAVDPRWLRRSLEKHYPDLLSIPTRAADKEATRPSTPQDYLEKIFQIPLYLRPISAAGYQGMIEQLAGEDLEKPQAPSASQTVPPPQNIPGVGIVHFPDGVGTETLEVEEQQLDPDQLRFREWELEDMEKLAVFFRTPRAVKRFVNTYRLVRAMVEPSKLYAFEGTKEHPGEYRWPMLLLGVIAGHPNTGLRFVMEIAKSCQQSPTMTTNQFLLNTFPAGPVANPDDPFGAEWANLRGSLDLVELPPSVASFQPWLLSVARFSFTPESAV